MATHDELISLGCDYVTVTAPEGGPADALRNYASGVFRHQSEIGNRPRAWGMSGFRGWRCGSIEIGVREDKVMVRMSSDVAQRSWRRLVQLSTNVTRLDLQATVRVSDGVTRRIDKYRRQARRDASKTKDAKVVRWIADNRGGYTLYLGSRESLVFGRIYDKFVQSSLPYYRDCVRFEVQFQRALANNVARAMLLDHAEISRISGYCRQFFKGRGLDVTIAAEGGATYSCSRVRSDVEKNLTWLSDSVRPCVRRLVDEGYGEEVFRALGLIVDDDSPLDQVGQVSQALN